MARKNKPRLYCEFGGAGGERPRTVRWCVTSGVTEEVKANLLQELSEYLQSRKGAKGTREETITTSVKFRLGRERQENLGGLNSVSLADVNRDQLGLLWQACEAAQAKAEATLELT